VYTVQLVPVLVPQNGGQYGGVVMVVYRPFRHETVFGPAKVPARGDIWDCIWMVVGVEIITLRQCDIRGLCWRIATLISVWRTDDPLSVYAEYFGP